MKKILFFFLAMCAFHISQAHDFGAVSSGKTIYYNITDPTNHYVMVVAPRLYFWYDPYDGIERPTGNIVIPSTVTHDGTTYSVTSIDNDAFKDCSGLTGVTIPGTVTSIGNYAFYNCYSLSTLNTSNATSLTSIGNYAFYNCALSSVTISEFVTTIGNYAFANCSSLTTLTTPYNPTSLTTIGEYAFQNCSALTGVSIPYSVTSIGNHAFENCTSLRNLEIVIPGMLTTIGDYAFNNCGISGSLTLTSAITSIGKYAFSYCPSITSVTLSNNITTIRKGTFAECEDLERINLPNSLTTIQDSAFFLCLELENPTLPSSLTSIGNYAFYYCSDFTSVSFPNSLTSIGNGAFKNCYHIESLSIPNSVTNLGEAVFAGCANLSSISLPNTLTSIKKETFSSCRNLTGLEIPNSVQSIGDNAFSGCLVLTSLTIPNSVTSLGSSAFKSCISLTSVVIGKSVTTIGSSAFNGCNQLGTIYNLSGLTLTTGASTYGNVAKNAKRVIVPDTFGTGANMLYQIPDTYRVKTTTSSATEVPTNAIPTNFIYDSLGDGNWIAHQIVLTDDTSRFEAPVDFTAAKATYTREFTNSNRSTLYLPFGVAEASTPENLEVYEFAGFNGSSISFAEHTGDIAAYTPYLVGYEISTKDGSTTKCTFSLEDVFFAETASASPDYVTTDGDESYGCIDFLGTTQRTCMTNTNYGYSNGYFVQSGNGTDHTGHAHVNPFRCYFSYIPGSAPMGIPPALDIDIVDGELAIDEAEMPAQQSRTYYSNDVYDMMGRLIRRNAQSLEGLPTGVYIWKGQKVLAY